MKYITRVFIDITELDKWLDSFETAKTSPVIIGYAASDGKIFITIHVREKFNKE